MNRAKVSVSVDPALLQAIDTYVKTHEGLDRSKVIDQALRGWTATLQIAAMEAQFAEMAEPPDEVASWRSIRRAAAARRIGGA